MKNIYFGSLNGIGVAAEHPYLVWNNIDGGSGSAFETYQEADACLSVKIGEWTKRGGKAEDSPIAIRCLMNGEWAKIDYFATV